MSSSGCAFVEKEIKEWNRLKKQFDKVKVFCGRICAEGVDVCPKHLAEIEYAADMPRRRAEKAARTKAWKKEQEERLVASPLKADNPEFAKARAWMEPGV